MLSKKGIQLLFIFCLMFVFSKCSKPGTDSGPLPSNYNASVYIGGDNHILFAINPVNGKKNWQYNFGSAITASPLIYNECLYIGTNSTANVGTPGSTSYPDTLYKLNAQTGALIKYFSDGTHPFHVISTPTASGGSIFLAGDNNNLYALDTGTFAVKWTYSPGTGGAFRSSPVVFDSFVYLGCDDGYVYCVNANSGAWVWKWNPVVPGSGVTGARPVVWYSSPAIGLGYGTTEATKDTVLCIGGNDSIWCLQLRFSPQEAQQDSFWWACPTKGYVNSSPTLYGGACIVGCEDNKLYCVDIQTGTPRWTCQAGGGIFSSPYVAGDYVYFGCEDDDVYCAKYSNGIISWKCQTGGMIKSSPMIYNGSLFVGSYDKSFYSINASTGQLQWSFVVNNNIDCSPAVDNNTGGFGVNSSISGFVN